jgi:hypothetical protein
MPAGDTGEEWLAVTQPEAAALRHYELAGFSIKRKQQASERNHARPHGSVQG